MKSFLIITLALLSSCSLLSAKRPEDKRKNIVFIMTDDFGFNDPSFRGNNEIITPNVDALFYQGVTLNHYYTHPLCTPSRAALMTGKYAHHLGLQSNVMWQHQPFGLGLDQKILPQYLKDVGYQTHLVGKWHLGHHQKQYWPTNRGFDSFFGFGASPFVDYFSRNSTVPQSNFPGNVFTPGYDWRTNLEVNKDNINEYVTDLLTDKTVEIIEKSGEDPFFIFLAHLAMHRATDEKPLQAKDEDIALFPHISNTRRKTYAAMVKAMDDSVGEVVDALRRAGKLDNTIIVFTNDNGGPTAIELAHPNTASNYPLRGMKGNAWEGGIRTNAAIYAPWLASGVVRDRPFHVSDWLQTLNTLASAGIIFGDSFDGIDLSKMVEGNQGPFRKEVEQIDQIFHPTVFISGQFKLVNSTYDLFPRAFLGGNPDTWLGSNDNADRESETYVDKVLNSKVAQSLRIYNGAIDSAKIQKVRASLKVECNVPVEKEVPCDPAITKEQCLYRIFDDPCEKVNLAQNPEYQEVFEDLKRKFAERIACATPSRIRPGSILADPTRHGGNWEWWQEDVQGEQPTNFNDACYSK